LAPKLRKIFGPRPGCLALSDEAKPELFISSGPPCLFKRTQEHRDFRNRKINPNEINEAWRIQQTLFPDEWLLRIELMELPAVQSNKGLSTKIRQYLRKSGKLIPTSNALVR